MKRLFLLIFVLMPVYWVDARGNGQDPFLQPAGTSDARTGRFSPMTAKPGPPWVGPGQA